VRNTIRIFLDCLVALQRLEIMGNPGYFIVVQLLLMCMGCHIPSPAVSFPCAHGRDTEKPGMLCLNHATVSHKNKNNNKVL
jgi:hypothetical protein